MEYMLAYIWEIILDIFSSSEDDVIFDDDLIIYDDIDIETGIIKIRKKGGAGTHNGMKSVVQELNTTEFPRIRVGTGNNEKITDLINLY